MHSILALNHLIIISIIVDYITIKNDLSSSFVYHSQWDISNLRRKWTSLSTYEANGFNFPCPEASPVPHHQQALGWKGLSNKSGKRPEATSYLGIDVVPIIQQLVQFTGCPIHGAGQQFGGHDLLLPPVAVMDWLSDSVTKVLKLVLHTIAGVIFKRLAFSDSHWRGNQITDCLSDSLWLNEWVSEERFNSVLCDILGECVLSLVNVCYLWWMYAIFGEFMLSLVNIKPPLSTDLHRRVS